MNNQNVPKPGSQNPEPNPRADIKNPNNAAFKAAQDNRSKQLNERPATQRATPKTKK